MKPKSFDVCLYIEGLRGELLHLDVNYVFRELLEVAIILEFVLSDLDHLLGYVCAYQARTPTQHGLGKVQTM